MFDLHSNINSFFRAVLPLKVAKVLGEKHAYVMSFILRFLLLLTTPTLSSEVRITNSSNKGF